MGAGKKILAISVGAVAAWAVAIKPRLLNKPDMSVFSAYDYANGGCHDFGHDKPENSLMAYKEALSNGYGVVIPVRLTRDGVPVAFADRSLWRMCSVDSNVEDTTLEKIKEANLLSTEEKVPTLEEALKFIDGQVPVIVQLLQNKDNYGVLCERCAEVLDEYEGIYSIQSSDYRAVRWFMLNRPNVIRGHVTERKPTLTSAFSDGLINTLQSRLFLNICMQPDYIACHLVDRKGISLNFCRLLYHVPIVHWTICTDEEYEASREEDAIVIFEDIRP